jgi:hypothetical protein
MKSEHLNCVIFVLMNFIKLSKQHGVIEGALVATYFTGMVGFNLDEIPDYAIVASKAYIMNDVTMEQWEKRASLQISHTLYRQVFRVYFHSPKLQLTLPPREVWKINFTSSPYEKVIQGHPHIVRDYSFYSVVVGPSLNLNLSEPLLDTVGGKWNDTFLVPTDPEHVFQRSGYACADEASFSFDTVNSENFWTYFDQDCGVEEYTPLENRTYEQSNSACHWTSFPKDTCIEALQKFAGYLELVIVWERISWNETIAHEYRYGNVTTHTGNLEGVHANLANDLNLVYKYIEPDSCTLKEAGYGHTKGCVSAPGWRHLLKFTSSSINIGKSEILVGVPVSNDYIEHGVYEMDTCHKHYHFQHFEDYSFGNLSASKVGFCLQTTWRYFNNEFTPFNTPFSSCDYQGVSTGWGDDYYAGLDCQWFDVTDAGPGVYELGIKLNPDKFICEGDLNLSSNGSIQWIETNFTSSKNTSVYRPDCMFTSGYDLDNYEHVMYNLIEKSTIVTLPCKRQATLSPLKDCGFEVKHDNLECKPDETFKIRLVNQHPDSHAVVRICETSKQLGHSIACEFVHSLANVIIESGSNVSISFKCPAKRSLQEPGGLFSILAASLLPSKPVPVVSIDITSSCASCSLFAKTA